MSCLTRLSVQSLYSRFFWHGHFIGHVARVRGPERILGRGAAVQLFQWDQTFATGSPVVDRQHQHLVEIINRFGVLLTSDASDTREIDKVCDQLIEYLNYHFAQEEQFMDAVGLDQRHIVQHRQQDTIWSMR